jgi:hypothetical protein
MPISEMNTFYREKKIFDPEESLKVYAKEIIGKKQELDGEFYR